MPNKKYRNNRYKNKNNKKFNKETYGTNRPKNTKNIEFRHKDQLTEKEVGITEFINKLDGFSGIIKARYSDFQVNEIDLDGNVAKLTNLSTPKLFEKNEQDDEIDVTNEKSPLDVLPQEIWDEIKKIAKGEREEIVQLEADNISKEDRGRIHECIKNHFKSKVVADTKNKEDKKFLIFKKYDPKDKNDRRQKWPEDKPEYVHFLVFKEYIDTLEATLNISDCLRIPASCFNYAGVKDKRAKTTQWFSVRKVEPWKLMVKTRPLRNVYIGNITFKDSPIKLGQLLGNKFRIALRNVIADDDHIKESLESLKENGFINYYGLQRFGNDKEVPTYEIGIQLLLGNWKEACSIILKPLKSDDEDLDITKAKKIFNESGDATKALEAFNQNKNKCIEYKLLDGLSKNHSNDYVTALEVVPRNVRLLYLHSFQSLIWNFATSKRIQQFGLQPVEGDLVLIKEERQDIDNEDGDYDENLKLKQEVKVLSKEDCVNYTIYDVVLPLPGYDVIYPEHLKDYYQELLEKHGLSLEMTKQKVQTYNVSGNYRKILGKLENFSWKIMHYNSPTCNLIQSDWDDIKKYPEPKDIPDGTYKALILEFDLNSSSYATMVLREILKTDTSSSEHAKLNNYHENNEEKKIVNNEEPVNFAHVENLLDNKDKYEAFKNSIFGAEEGSKRNLEDDEAENKNNKVLKTE